MSSFRFDLLAHSGYLPKSFSPGEVIFEEGSKGDTMFVVRSGEVAIEHGGRILETVPAGGMFGEMALIDQSTRSATARAKTACDVQPIDERGFLLLVNDAPLFALAVMRVLAERLRRSNERA